MAEYILSVDPGISTGVALLAYDDSSVSLAEAWQFRGGTLGLLEFLSSHWTYGFGFHPRTPSTAAVKMHTLTVIAEKFTARATTGFSYTTASLEPLRCEGALIALGLIPDYDVKEKRWRDPGLQYLVGGKDKADKKKRQHKFLKDSGFYVTGKQLESPDADDTRSAIAHGIAYLAREKKHAPSFKLMTDWSEAND